MIFFLSDTPSSHLDEEEEETPVLQVSAPRQLGSGPQVQDAFLLLNFEEICASV